MAGQRKAIRDAIKTALESDFDCSIFTSRKVDSRGASEYINIFFESGDVDNDTLQSQTTAAVVVGYHVTDIAGELPTDDDLDVMADTILAQLTTHGVASDILQGLLNTGFEYGDDDDGEYSSIYLRFDAIYQ